jgi:hypothetical protein
MGYIKTSIIECLSLSSGMPKYFNIRPEKMTVVHDWDRKASTNLILTGMYTWFQEIRQNHVRR